MALYKFILSTAVRAMMLQNGMMCEDEHIWRVRISDRLSSHGRIGKTKTQYQVMCGKTKNNLMEHVSKLVGVKSVEI
jgi:hypothetical protein